MGRKKSPKGGKGKLKPNAKPMPRGQRKKELAPPESMIVDLSPEEEAKALELFRLYDYDNSGTICVAELTDLLEELSIPVSKQMVMDYLGVAHKNLKDKSVNFDEFKGVYRKFVSTQPTAVRKQNRGDVRTSYEDIYFTDFMLRQAFKFYDADGSGKLDCFELCGLFEDIGFPDVYGDQYQSMVDNAVELFDHDGDRLIDYHEFTHYVNHVLNEIHDQTIGAEKPKRY